MEQAAWEANLALLHAYPLKSEQTANYSVPVESVNLSDVSIVYDAIGKKWLVAAGLRWNEIPRPVPRLENRSLKNVGGTDVLGIF